MLNNLDITNQSINSAFLYSVFLYGFVCRVIQHTVWIGGVLIAHPVYILLCFISARSTQVPFSLRPGGMHISSICASYGFFSLAVHVLTQREQEKRAEDKGREIMASQHRGDPAQLADIFKRLEAKVLGSAGTAVRGAVLLLTVEACKEREQGPLPWARFYELRECTARAMSAYLEKKNQARKNKIRFQASVSHNHRGKFAICNILLLLLFQYFSLLLFTF